MAFTKILITGGSQVGKSSYIKICKESQPADLKRRLLPSKEIDDYIDGAIILFSRLSLESLELVPSIYQSIVEKYKDIPIVICGTHIDFVQRTVSMIFIRKFFVKNNLHRVKYFDLSNKTYYNFNHPFKFIDDAIQEREAQILAHNKLIKSQSLFDVLYTEHMIS